MSHQQKFFATAPKGLAPILTKELAGLGAGKPRPQSGGVTFAGDLVCGMRVCLWSRVASRVLLELGRFTAADSDSLYAGARGVVWAEHLAADGTLAVSVTTTRSPLTHTHFAALRVKDAIVDQFREATGERPSVDTERPDIRVHAHLRGERATIYLDLSGESLHRRGYRIDAAVAPLKENLAAAILLRAAWPRIASAGGRFVDPACGAGTLAIEAALIAGDVAPGLSRDYFGFFGWKGCERGKWNQLLAEARARRDAGLGRVPTILGFDPDDTALAHARANAQRAGVDGLIEFQCRPLARCLSGEDAPPAGGLLAVNPPYGKRMGTEAEVAEVHRDLNDVLRTRPPGWYAAVLTARPEMLAQDVTTSRRTSLYNGPLRCSLLEFAATEMIQPGDPSSASQATQHKNEVESSESQEMLANRLKKNLKRLGRWARREDVSCYRLYDADLPEYAVAVDFYQGEQAWVQIQEYAPPKTVDSASARRRLREAVTAVRQVLELPMDAVAVKVRRRQRGAEQYARLSSRSQMMEVREGGLRFLVNQRDYLDTGLFLHHRLTRQLIRELSQGQHVLNLFGYTGAVTVYAAAGAAASTTTVDLSKTYLDWARRNMALNGHVEEAHQFVQADCSAWLREATQDTRAYEVIFLDPPTFSNSKRMQSTLDTQRDHPMLVRLAMQRLTKDGVLVFTTNRRQFRLDPALQEEFQVKDITRETTPPDFLRRRPHHCWRFSFA